MSVFSKFPPPSLLRFLVVQKLRKFELLIYLRYETQPKFLVQIRKRCLMP